MSKIVTLTFAFLFLLLWSCSDSKNSRQADSKTDSLATYYYSDGKTVHTQIQYKDKKPHGWSRQYFDNGQLFEEIPYVNGTKHGIAKRYYEDGKMSMETPYDSGLIHGVQKKFRKDGSIAYEAPYFHDRPVVGLKEYFTNGKPVDNYPEIVFKENTSALMNNRFSLDITLSKPARSVTFYSGKLRGGKYLEENAKEIWSPRDGAARLDFYLPPGAFVMEKIQVIAVITTELNNSYIIEKTYNLAYENR